MASTVTIEPVSNREDWIETFSAMDEDGAEIDLTGATIMFAAVDPVTDSSVLAASTDDGTITISTTVATINIPVATMRSVTVFKEYKVGLTIELNSLTRQLFTGTMPIYDGVVP